MLSDAKSKEATILGWVFSSVASGFTTNVDIYNQCFAGTTQPADLTQVFIQGCLRETLQRCGI